MNVDHVVPYVGDQASGPAYSVVYGCKSLADVGVNVGLHALAPSPDIPGVTVHAYPRHTWPHPSLGRSPEMLEGLKRAAGRCEILHNHSLWMLNNIYPLQALQGTQCKLVCSPHGTMAPWAWRRSPIKKMIMRRFGQQANLDATEMFQATSEAEYLDIRALGFKQPIALIPNGIDIPPLTGANEKTKNIMLFLGRVHPVKGIDLLLRSWSQIANRYPDWELHIVGPDSTVSYTNSLKLWVAENEVRGVEFTGPRFNSDKQDAYRGARVLVLPSHTENFGMVVAESLANGTPVITTRGTPWKDLETNRCGWWIERSQANLRAALEAAMNTPSSELTAMGMRGREWMTRDFSWLEIGQKLKASYEWILRGGERPSCVYVD